MREPEEGLTSLEALGLAIRAEMDAIDLYHELAERCDRSLVSRRFEQLAAEEEQHRAYLVEKWEDLAGGVELKLPPSQLPPEMGTRSGRAAHTIEEVLDLAIEEERRSRDFYLQAARETEDLSGQQMFRYLADMEYRHWMHLAQERDLLSRYPRYHRAAPVPWSREPGLGGRQRKE